MQPVLCDHTSVELRFNSTRDLASSRRVCKHSESPDQTSQVAQANRNKLQHALHGNTVLRLDTLIPLGSPPGPSPNQPKQLNLTSLIPCPSSTAEPPQGMYPYSHTISKHTLLAMRTPTESLSPQLPQTTPLTTPVSATTTPKGRTGRRRRAFSPNGTPIFYKINKKKSPNSRIRRIKTLVTPTTPPPRGVPGAPSGANEECTPTRAEHSATGGGTKRRLARRAYRRWCKGSTTTPLEGAGSPSEVRTSPTKATQRTSVWFRKTILWQDGIKRKAKKQQNTQLTTPPLSYGSKLRVGALNVQGFADTLKLKNVIQLMEEHNLDVITLSETRSTSYYSYTSEKHLVILSGNTRDKFAGVGAVIHPRVRPHLADIIQVSNRLLHLVFNKKGGKVHVLGAYAPHSGHDHDTVREPFWNKLEEYIDKIPQPEFVTLTGDFNVRFQGAHSSDQGVTGPYTYGKGKQWVDHTATGNRALCVRTMQRLHMVEAASYKTPSPTQQITYRDKAAPPTDWSQYLLDPLIMQQFYTHLQAKDPAQALTIASQIRAYLDLPQPLPPPKRQPTADPIRFQRLDHTFVRAQWLSGVNSCKSKLHTGFPSDHYLLVTEVQVKLAQRSKPSHPRVRYDFKQTTIDHQHSFNNTFRAALDAGPADTSQTTPQPRDPELRPHLRIYTDGSGTRGKATANTAAGWGWTYQDLDGEWVSASGPVITTRDHTSYLGAGVGSNNTGELTAIIEALLYCAETDHTSVQIVSDSQWAINVITGRWRSKAHKPMVQRAQHLYRKSGLKVNFKWTKAHVGTEGNEKADRLAEQGKRSETTTGGRTQPVLPLATTPHQLPQVSATQAVQRTPPRSTSLWLRRFQEHPGSPGKHFSYSIKRAKRKPRNPTTQKPFEIRQNGQREKIGSIGSMRNYSRIHQAPVQLSGMRCDDKRKVLWENAHTSLSITPRFLGPKPTRQCVTTFKTPNGNAPTSRRSCKRADKPDHTSTHNNQTSSDSHFRNLTMPLVQPNLIKPQARTKFQPSSSQYLTKTRENYYYTFIMKSGTPPPYRKTGVGPRSFPYLRAREPTRTQQTTGQSPF